MSAERPPSPTLARRHLAGIALTVVGVLCFSGLDASAKWLNHSISPLQTVSVRSIGSFPVVAPFLVYRERIRQKFPSTDVTP